MNTLAIKMLFGDRAKYLMLVSGIVFASVLMSQGLGLFCGIMTWTYATITNVRAPIWVGDPAVEQVGDNRPLRDTDVDRVRSVSGVAWAVAFYKGAAQARLFDGNELDVTLLGLDDTTLTGAPAVMVQGRVEDLRLPHAVIIDAYGLELLSRGSNRQVGFGETFEMNDHEARIVGVCRTVRSFQGGPCVFCTYSRAVSEYEPPQRKMLSFVLAAPQTGLTAEVVAGRIHTETGLGAFTEDQFSAATMRWSFQNTPVPFVIGFIVAVGFLIGTAISGQTFYAFVLENLRNLGALKAMGADVWTLCRMLCLQAGFVGLMGYSIGLGLVSMLGRVALRTGALPFLWPWQVPVGLLGAILFICGLAALLGIVKVARLEPSVVFRG